MLQVTIQPFQNTRTHHVCLAANRTGGNVSEDNRTVREYGCKERTLGSVGTRVKFDLDPLGINQTGRYDLVVTVRGGDRVDNATVPVFVLEREGDIDGDGLSNAAELERGADLNDVDTDSDGIQDGPEVHSYGTDPTAADTDADGLRDAVEIRGDTEPTEPDTDGDGLADGAEANQYGTDPKGADTDGDGLADGAEVTEYHTDPTAADTDGDGLSDGEEVNRYDTNPIEADTDGDGYTDGEEVLRYHTDPRDPADRPAGGLLGGLTDLQSTSGLGILLVVGALSAVGVVAYLRMRAPSSPTEPLEDGQSDDATAGEILSPEERVHRLLDEHGGELRQREIVGLTDWSKAKVSRILSRMEDSGGRHRTDPDRPRKRRHPGR